MSRPKLASIVEGHGEVSAVPELLRRLVPSIDVLKPHRLPKGRMRVDLARAVRLQGDRVGADGGVLVLVDADDDDPAQLQQLLQGQVDAGLSGSTRVVVAIKEYEAWFLAGIGSLRSHRSVRDDATYEADPEAPRGAKSHLSPQILEPYQETIHQVAFSAIVDLDEVAGSSDSFLAFRSAVSELVGQETSD